VLLSKCADHFFHLECLQGLLGNKKFIKCPNCNAIYGILTGDQPPGKMLARITKDKCKGYNCNTIEIFYDFKNGKEYSGTRRTAYLPNNKEGREILGLLKIAFERKLTFVVGTSVTTGLTNTTVWNGIHHKTNLSGGSVYFGYPDPTYFNRVRQELAAKGVIEDSISQSLENIAADLLSKSKNK